MQLPFATAELVLDGQQPEAAMLDLFEMVMDVLDHLAFVVAAPERQRRMVAQPAE